MTGGHANGDRQNACAPHEGSKEEVERALLEHLYFSAMGKSQANEGMWGMPGHIEAMKAAVSCDKLGGAAHTH